MSDPEEKQIDEQETAAEAVAPESQLEDLAPESTEELATVKGGRRPSYM